MTIEERQAFLYAVGQQFAYKGNGVFVFYNSVGEAFKDAQKFPYYRVLKFEYGLDSMAFARGYLDTKAKLHAIWKAKDDAEATIKKIAASIDLTSQSYVYDKDKPRPFDYSGGCAQCDKQIDKCNCDTFKGRPNPKYQAWLEGGK